MVQLEEEVTGTEWFFLVSMTQSFFNGSGLPGQALLAIKPTWIAAGLDGTPGLRLRPPHHGVRHNGVIGRHAGAGVHGGHPPDGRERGREPEIQSLFASGDGGSPAMDTKESADLIKARL